uniref:NADH-ubiquinone oxidoreductase chain 4L n=1 Tax=Portunus pelagicus TaxID=80836 RepID=A0A0B4VK99_PORPE|nr:NADH dehydrogenase subunit 4L [Portunus pelagicus]WMQ53320.1 NADH dehydrogenase subunit 4L [Portunus armatus]AJD22392.1 NADH dehydrogenase subunit 4L [Portunus pelagicus]AKR18002.1 NADH dehydrogenase subunit 4L [Portunus pelagicus]ALJ01877.1 NADH dehydrogenase subunit 4L [Portunus pelagicus]WMQ53333.1 NADH dehydrogenase subunit 4L [Portunus armatus]
MMNFSSAMVFVPMVMIFCGVWGFIAYNKHMLNSLLSLEFMMLGVFWLMSSQLALVASEVYFSLFFLTLAACEGALGLTMLILVVRSHGNDVFSSFNLLEC